MRVERETDGRRGLAAGPAVDATWVAGEAYKQRERQKTEAEMLQKERGTPTEQEKKQRETIKHDEDRTGKKEKQPKSPRETQKRTSKEELQQQRLQEEGKDEAARAVVKRLMDRWGTPDRDFYEKGLRNNRGVTRGEMLERLALSFTLISF